MYKEKTHTHRQNFMIITIFFVVIFFLLCVVVSKSFEEWWSERNKRHTIVFSFSLYLSFSIHIYIFLFLLWFFFFLRSGISYISCTRYLCVRFLFVCFVFVTILDRTEKWWVREEIWDKDEKESFYKKKKETTKCIFFLFLSLPIYPTDDFS